MNKFKYFFILLIALFALVSCNKNNNDDDFQVEPLRDFATQYATDKATIEGYLNTHYIIVSESPGNVEDMDVVIDSIEDPLTQVPIMSYKANVGTAVYPQLKSKNVDLHGITYQYYYLVLREGSGESPMNTDGVLASYSGSYLKDVAKTDKNSAYIKATFFEQLVYPQSFTDLTGVVLGWSEIFPEFKTGIAVGKDDGNISYKDFGAGVMFIPSGLGYYNTGKGSIPSYSPLVFSFKLYKLQRLDHDGDGVLDVDEDINGDGYVRDYRNTTLYPNAPVNPDDTDKDGVADFIDIDDDGDGYTTLLEITKPTGEVGGAFGPSKYFPFEAFAVEDDPTTPNINEALNSEPRGIPSFLKTITENGVTRNEYDYTTPGRKKIHLDKDHNTTKVTTITAKK
ncbi:FKBP-type peptidyl-prolyl cis-trans isomerase [Flavobacterium hibisci]|uniref:FKBP-type peptidyl-prolyl cis-trans isomerase n=1 Tax=Flavobacterium hibisci TaxID=1914462 RepID=UPI001CBC5756|nr:FKBP-type peptidylprolyl isomerase [Flavobacterium hibisci]MBZ4043283.1 FKBP-type peptidylprolyl isomerase [Flavobacterium hibisci]